ncbi:MAG: gliding motility-associated C-terminal domain-containing protein [Bacteroidota bacterium]
MLKTDWKLTFCALWYFCFVTSPLANAVTFSWTNARPSADEILTTALQVNNFEDMASLQFSVHWDTSLLHFLSYERIGLTSGLAIGATEVERGILQISWFDLTGTGKNLSSGSELIALSFSIKACGGEEASLRFADTPLAIQVYQLQQGEAVALTPTFEVGRFEFAIPDLIPIAEDTTLRIGDTLLLDVSCTGCTYFWNDGSMDAQLSISTEGFYALSLLTPTNCTYMDQVLVSFETPLDRLCPVNVISPNGDGRNDRLDFGPLDQLANNRLTIFNRWGKILFDRLNYDNSWSGQYKNQDLPAGNYYYILELGNGWGMIKSSLKIIRP